MAYTFSTLFNLYTVTWMDLYYCEKQQITHVKMGKVLEEYLGGA